MLSMIAPGFMTLGGDKRGLHGPRWGGSTIEAGAIQKVRSTRTPSEVEGCQRPPEQPASTPLSERDYSDI
jgi:hypothetical protein